MHNRIIQALILLLILLVATECFASEAIPQPTGKRFIQSADASISLERLKAIRNLFDSRKFKKLTNIYEQLQKQFEQDPTDERPIVQAFSVFKNSNHADKALLDEWVALQPNHYAPYLARARHLAENAWNIGKVPFSESSPKEYEKLLKSDFLKLAHADLKKALSVKPNLLPAYLELLALYNALGYDVGEDQTLREAKRLFPDSYLLYSTALWIKLPSWGGSYGEMKKLAIEAYENSQNNREKTLVLGLLYLESIRGRYSKKEDTEKGLKLFEKAFAYGENSRFYHDRGLFYLPKKGKRWLAIRDFSKELELHPGNYRALRYRAELYRDAGETESALADINDAWAVWPEHAELLPLYEWSLQQSAAGKSVKKSRRSSSVSKKSTIKPPNVEPASSLEVKEAFSAPPSTKTAGLTWLNGRLYMGASYSWNILYEIDAKSGKVLRKQRTPFGDIAWMPLLANDGKDIYITRNSRAKSTVRLGTTSLEKEDVFKLKSSERSIGDTAIHDGAIYTIGKNSLYDEDSYRLLKFSLEGTLLESFQYHQTSKKSRPLSKRDFVYNIGMTSDGSNLWAVAGTKLLRINPKSGNVEKVYPLSVKQARSLAWDGEKLWTIGAGGTFYTIKVID